MTYGWFFYPLITLGAEQCSLVLEAALRKRCIQAGIPTYRTTKKGKQIDTKFAENVESLITAGIIDVTEKSDWDFTRLRRNFASHPDSQSIVTPGIAINTLVSTAELLNSLYK